MNNGVSVSWYTQFPQFCWPAKAIVNPLNVIGSV